MILLPGGGFLLEITSVTVGVVVDVGVLGFAWAERNETKKQSHQSGTKADIFHK
jgi:hypothetical protein